MYLLYVFVYDTKGVWLRAFLISCLDYRFIIVLVKKRAVELPKNRWELRIKVEVRSRFRVINDH